MLCFLGFWQTARKRARLRKRRKGRLRVGIVLLPAISHGTASHLPFRGAHRRSFDVAPRKGDPFAGGHIVSAGGPAAGAFFLGRLGLSNFGIGFGTLEQVDSLSIITQVALGFIAFVIGNEFRLSALESMGKQAITVGILQAVMTTALVDAALVILHFIRPDIISMASAITLGAIAAATAPAATLMVVKQYKADGPLTRLLLMVVAIDDAVGLVLFSASFGIANALEQGRIDAISILASRWWRSSSRWVWAPWRASRSTSWKFIFTPAPNA